MVSEKIKEEGSCGKSCEFCLHHQANDCPGCAQKPGQEETGACALARSRRERGEQACSVCSLRVVCGMPCDPYGTWITKAAAPTAIHRTSTGKGKNTVRRSPELIRLSRAVAPRLWILFWVSIARLPLAAVYKIILSPQVTWPLPFFLNLIYYVVVCMVLSFLSREERKYRAAAVGNILFFFTNAATLFALSERLELGLSLVETAATFVFFYLEYHAHASLTEQADPALAEKWKSLWSWTRASVIAFVVSLLLSFVVLLFVSLFSYYLDALYIFSNLLLLFATVAQTAVFVLYYVYLYRTASLFTSITRNPEKEGQKPKQRRKPI